VIVERNRVEVEDVELPPLGANDVLLEAECSLISTGTELAGVRGLTPRPPGASSTSRPVGYSFVGIVRGAGAVAAAGGIGQGVVGEGGQGGWGVGEGDGRVGPVPDDVAPGLAAFVVLLTVALNGVRLAHIQIGEPVAVLGQGLVGQLAGQLARVNGARPVVAL